VGVFDKLERGLERAVKQPFARVFKAEVQPVEIASAMRKSMDDRAAVLGPGRTMVPNVFTIELAATDFERLDSYDRALTDELVAAAEDHADAQRYVAPGPFEVRLVSGDDLETGIFRVRPAAKDGRQGRGGGSAREYADASRELDRRRPGGPGRPGQDPAATARRDGDRGDRRGRGQEDPLGSRGGDPMAAYRPDSGRAAAAGAPLVERTRAVDAGGSAAPRRRSTGSSPVALEIDGRRHPLTGAVTTLGRDEGCTIVVDDAGASRRHAEIRISHDGPHLQVILRDLGSTNGTYLNGEQVGSEELRDRDRITMGRTHIVVHLEG
jgi:hypothetical protein